MAWTRLSEKKHSKNNAQLLECYFKHNCVRLDPNHIWAGLSNPFCTRNVLQCVTIPADQFHDKTDYVLPAVSVDFDRERSGGLPQEYTSGFRSFWRSGLIEIQSYTQLSLIKSNFWIFQLKCACKTSVNFGHHRTQAFNFIRCYILFSGCVLLMQFCFLSRLILTNLSSVQYVLYMIANCTQVYVTVQFVSSRFEKLNETLR